MHSDFWNIHFVQKFYLDNFTNKLIRNYDIEKVCKRNLKKTDEPKMGIKRFNSIVWLLFWYCKNAFAVISIVLFSPKEIGPNTENFISYISFFLWTGILFYDSFWLLKRCYILLVDMFINWSYFTVRKSHLW